MNAGFAPALLCSAAPPLAGLLAELAGMLNQRGEALAARLTAPGAARGGRRGRFPAAAIGQPAGRTLLAHWADAGNVHPADLYAALVQMAGEFATFVETTRRPSNYPPYRHDDLQRSFAPVVADLRRALSAVIEQTAIPIPLQERRHGVRVGADHRPLDPALGRASCWRCRPMCRPRRCAACSPSQVKIGAVEQIRELVNVALPGIAVRPLPVAPRQIAVLRRRDLFRAGSQFAALAADANLRRLRDRMSPAISRTSASSSGRSAADDIRSEAT